MRHDGAPLDYDEELERVNRVQRQERRMEWVIWFCAAAVALCAAGLVLL